FGQLFVRILLFNLDVLLEKNTNERQTGKIRGIFLTITNIAVVISPFISGSIIENGDYKNVYLLSSIILIPILFLLFYKFRKYNKIDYIRHPIGASISKILRRPDLVRIFSSNLLLRTFYAFMVIYSPIYLHETMGFSWEEIGIVFTIMLLPFILFELPLGKLADTRFGEKEMLSIGFIITGLSTASIFFMQSQSLLLWVILLFITRTGASIIEIMTETYFFKKVSPDDSDIISTYRMVDPVGYIIGPIIGTLILSITNDTRFIFLVLGMLLILGLRFSMSLRDTL
ncbi:MAG: MFS transporter, partial [Patescibacteria group bacterium]